MGLNALVPLLFSGYLYTLFKKYMKVNYKYWSIGFFLFSVSNIFIALEGIFGPSIPLLYTASTITSMLSFSSIIIGIGYFVQKPRVFFLLSSFVPIMTLVLTVLGYSTVMVENLTAIVYLILTFCIYWMRIKFELSLEIVDLGWVIILVANLGYIFGQMTLLMTYAFSIIGKVIVFLWMSRPRFIAFTEEIENFLLSGDPHPVNIASGISIVETSSQKENDIQWMKDRLGDEAMSGVRKILVMTSEVFSREEILNSGLVDIPNLYIVQISQTFHPQKPVFSEKIVSISNDLNILNAMLGEIISFVDEKSIRTCIMINNFSTLIHVHGWRSLYAMLISNIPQLKQNNIDTYFLISPLTHENQHEVIQVRQFGDNNIKI
jgi:hypothetical protein